MNEWTKWRPFPDPQVGGYLTAPFGPGVYEVRNGKTGAMVLFGRGKRCASRMCSLLPDGGGTRHNSTKRSCVLEHLVDVEYRTRAFATESEMVAFEDTLRKRGGYVFAT